MGARRSPTTATCAPTTRAKQDRAEVEARIKAAFPELERLELLSAELCRPELLVEVEGLAEGPPELVGPDVDQEPQLPRVRQPVLQRDDRAPDAVEVLLLLELGAPVVAVDQRRRGRPAR